MLMHLKKQNLANFQSSGNNAFLLGLGLHTETLSALLTVHVRVQNECRQDI